MSVAFFPRLGLFAFGSEASATKAGLGSTAIAPGGAAENANLELLGEAFLDGFRFGIAAATRTPLPPPAFDRPAFGALRRQTSTTSMAR